MQTFDVTKKYNKEDFTNFLSDFLPDDFEQNEEELYADFKNIKTGFRLGECKSLDLTIFEFSVVSANDPRVTLTREVCALMKKYESNSNALAVFYNTENSQWRFSLITTDYETDKKGNNKPLYSNPKRFSFALGEGCKRHTPESMLFEKGTVKATKDKTALDDLKSRFAIEVVTKEFYSELFAWYEWACKTAAFPTSESKGENVTLSKKDNNVALIRLITRIMFVWFIKHKKLVPDEIFTVEGVKQILVNFNPNSKTDCFYYNAILQNLFFATLNKAITERQFTKNTSKEKDEHYGVKSFYRDANERTYFSISHNDVIKLFEGVPFLNGGLFECLDWVETDNKKTNHAVVHYVDGFSRDEKRRAKIPNCLFFTDSEKSKNDNNGLFNILNRYNFTVEENSPSEVEVALDPELLGKVFENLLGTYNPETKETARKSSGSFYTPRPIVDFMINESLITYLHNKLPELSFKDIETFVNSENENIPESIKSNAAKIGKVITEIRILDPACGSGAFPMGALNKMVALLQKLSVKPLTSLYESKRNLIEKCIFGLDIQPIAVQIVKLRFFISLICEQEKTDDKANNYGYNPLPNLETKFVAANTLRTVSFNTAGYLNVGNTKDLHDRLMDVRQKHFNAPTAEVKKEYRKQDENLREQILVEISKTDDLLDKKRIADLQKEIDTLQNKIENLKPEYVDKYEEPDLFGTKQTLFKVDKNEDKRNSLKVSLKEKQKYFTEETSKAKKDRLTEELKKLAEWNPYDQNKSSVFFDPDWMFGESDGFDIVIGNPPYISTKDVTLEDKTFYEEEFGFSDDTYNLFTFKGLSLAKENGTLSYIIPKTFWTTQTKHNMRDLILGKQINYIFDTADPFESVMVDTCIMQVQNCECGQNHKIRFMDGSKDLNAPVFFEPVNQQMYINTQNSVIFKPTDLNLKIWQLYGKKVRELYNTWWEKIKTSKDISINKKELEEYRKSLKPGDVALLGCLTEGGQGLATANNGKYIAVRKSTKWARNIEESRYKKLEAAVKENGIKPKELDGLSPDEFLSTKNEKQIAAKFDELKEKYGRDIFGQGYIYRLIDDSNVADVETLTEDEKTNGIETSKKFYVPYDKGDKDGNRWYLETPFAIAWSKENVRFLKTDSRARYQGYTFFFKEGFCWSLINGTRSENDLKFRFSSIGVNDVGGMALHSMNKIVPDWFIVCLGNSWMFSRYSESFLNFTVNFQINDARQIPILIPTQEQLINFKRLFYTAEKIKKSQFSSSITQEKAEEQLAIIQTELDSMVKELYKI